KDKEKDKDKADEETPTEPTDKALMLSPGRRAIDAVIGLSFVSRNLNFDYASDLGKPPPGYKQTIPVAGAVADVTMFPLSFNHNPKGIVGGLGLNVMYDRVLIISSKKKYADASGTQQIADLKTEESRWSIGAVLRYPLGKDAKAPVVGGKLSYGKQTFSVAQ